ncbi:MAG: hypothetical protein Q9214_004210, partial [Letrouitia sp. 1 TL-2023]
MQMLTHASPWHEVVYVAGRLELVDVDEIVGEELPEDPELEYTVLDVMVELPELHEKVSKIVLGLLDEEETLIGVNVTTPVDPVLEEVVLDVIVAVWLEVELKVNVVCEVEEVL